MKPRLTHVALHLINFDACIDFYKTYCQLEIIHQRSTGAKRIVWMAEQGREKDFIFVMMSGGQNREQLDNDYSHLGFALESKAAVDTIAAKARKAHCLAWEAKEEPYPVGYYCGLKDPDGAFVEFSYGQPLGPGAEKVSFHIGSSL